MHRYGEITRFDCGSYLYILKGEQYVCRFGDAVWLDFFISRRTSRKRKIKNEQDAQYSLGSDGGVQAIRYVMKFLKLYLDEYQPKWLAVMPYDDQERKRTVFYQKCLAKLGYEYVCRDVDEYGQSREWVDLYKRR